MLRRAVSVPLVLALTVLVWTTLPLWVLGAAAACLVHSLSSWHVLKRRFQVRYEIW